MVNPPPRFEDLLHSIRSPVDPEAVNRILEATKLPGNAWLLAHWIGFLREIVRRRRQIFEAIETLDHDPKLKTIFKAVANYQNLKDWTDDFISSEFLAGIYTQIFDRPASYSEGGPCMRFIQAVLKEVGIERSRDTIRSGVKRHLDDKRKAEERRKTEEEQAVQMRDKSPGLHHDCTSHVPLQ